MLDAAGNRKARNRLAQVDAWRARPMAWGPKEAGDGIKGLRGSSMPAKGRDGKREGKLEHVKGSGRQQCRGGSGGGSGGGSIAPHTRF